MRWHFIREKMGNILNFMGNAKYYHTGDNVSGDKIVTIYNNVDNTAEQPKHFTNKKLVVPFTIEASNGAQGGTYVSMDDLLERIAVCYKSQTGTKRIVFVSGMGGYGKSELARAYASQHRNEYEEIFWLTCKDGVRQQLMELFSEADTLREVGKADANGFSNKVLIIVDNYNSDESEFLFELEKATGDADILVTTRLSRIGDYRQIVFVGAEDLKSFAFKVFKRNYCKRPRWSEPKEIKKCEIEAINNICREVQYNTMMVSLIGIRLREFSDLSITDCAIKIINGVGKIRGKIRYNKDQNDREEELRDILCFLFSDILNYSFSEYEEAILTVLSLAPAKWYLLDYVIELCKGLQSSLEYERAVNTLLNRGWIQGNGRRTTIHPLIAEVISENKKISEEPIFFEQLIENYLSMPDQYLGKNRFLINKILNLGKSVVPEKKLVVMLLINNGEYNSLFAKMFPEVKAAYIVYVSHDGMHSFLYQDLKKDKEQLLVDLPCQVMEGGKAELKAVIHKGDPYILDLNRSFFGLSIEEIPDGICRGDYSITGCVFPSKLKTIGDSAFEMCTNFSGELKLPEELTSIGKRAFRGCNSLSGGLKLSEGLTSIGEYAFSDCQNLNGELSFPKRITSIKKSTFENCKKLKCEMNFPEGLANIDDRAFCNCSNLNGELKLPASLIGIGDSTFSNCTGLRGKLRLPDGLKSIGDYAFLNCKSLTGEVDFPESLISIGDYAFMDCDGLSKEQKLPSRAKIGKQVFLIRSCVKEEQELPEIVEEKPQIRLPNQKKRSKDLEVIESLTRIDDFAFLGRKDLCGELRLSKNLTKIGDYAFMDCTGLCGKLMLPEKLTRIGLNAFSGCTCFSGELKLPMALEYIDSFAFSGCKGLSGTLRFPEGIKRIGSYAFAGCTGLKVLILPKSLAEIGYKAFEMCRSVEKIVILNPKLRIKGVLILYSSMVVYGYRNSTAEQYAREQGLVFEKLEM